MYRLELQVARPLCLAVHQDDEAWRWHERLGHANFVSLEKNGQAGDGARAAADQPCRTVLQHVRVSQASPQCVPIAEPVPCGQGTRVSARRSLWVGQASDFGRVALLSAARR
jgi:hypothetical protein